MTYIAEPACDNTVDVDFSDDIKQNSKYGGHLRGAE
jgi:hypothetical protein